MPVPTDAKLHSWRRRPIAAGLIRAGATVIPLAVSIAVGVALHSTAPQADPAAVSVIRWLAILVVSMGALVATDSLARRFLPLATLLQLSLAFPDELPSRFKLALHQGSGRRLVRLTDEATQNGISEEPREAAQQLVVLAAALGDHDRRTRGHSERVRLVARLIGEELGLSEEELAKLEWAGLLHDIGKVVVPSEILNKKGAPDAREWRILQQHPEAGEELVKTTEPWLGEWVHAVGAHHERWDGTGYPRGLAGYEIPRSATIIALADSFEVMTAIRSYKTAMPLDAALREVERSAGSHFDPEAARALLNVSIPKLRRAVGILATLAHLPFLGRVSTAAAHSPDAVVNAVGATSSVATAGAGAVAVSAALTIAATGGEAPAELGVDADAIELVSVDSEDPEAQTDDQVETLRQPHTTPQAEPTPSTSALEATTPPAPPAPQPFPAAPVDHPDAAGPRRRPVTPPVASPPSSPPAASRPTPHGPHSHDDPPSPPGPPPHAGPPPPAGPPPHAGPPSPPGPPPHAAPAGRGGSNGNGIGDVVSEMARNQGNGPGGIGAAVRDIARGR